MAERGGDSESPDWGYRVWQVVALLFAAYVILQQTEALLWDAHLVPQGGTLGAEQAQLRADPGYAPGFVVVTRVAPGSPLDRAGVLAGDHLRFDPIWDYLRYKRSGERLSLTLDHAGHRSRLDLVTVPRVPGAAETRGDLKTALFDLSNLIPALFGAFILGRSRGRVVAMLLGTALVVFGLGVASPQLWQAWPQTFLLLYGLHLATIVSVNIFLLAFALRFAGDWLGGVKGWQRIAFASYVLINACLWAVWFYCSSNVVAFAILGDGTGPLQVASDIGFAASLLLLILGWRRAPALERRRFSLMLIGFSAIVISQVIAVYVFIGMEQLWDTTHPLLLIAELLSGVVAPVMLTYAILRHRVFDLGFALNRSLIFTGVSAIMLVGFGLIDWAVDHFLKIEGRKGNALIDAGIALGVFLTFHRVRDFVKLQIERLFFHRWQDNEARLRRFVHEAAYVLKPEVLTAAFVAELERFSDGASAALYLRNQTGNYALAGGHCDGAPQTVDADEPALVGLRSHRSVLELEETTSPLPVNLALPMLNRADLLGFVLLSTKPSTLGYRPDEKEVLAYATQQVGSDLHALEIERLQQRVASLEARNDELRSALSERTVAPREDLRSTADTSSEA